MVFRPCDLSKRWLRVTTEILWFIIQPYEFYYDSMSPKITQILNLWIYFPYAGRVKISSLSAGIANSYYFACRRPFWILSKNKNFLGLTNADGFSLLLPKQNSNIMEKFLPLSKLLYWAYDTTVVVS